MKTNIKKIIIDLERKKNWLRSIIPRELRYREAARYKNCLNKSELPVRVEF